MSSSPARSRRDFLLLRSEGRATVLSCEALFMRFLDAESTGTVNQLFASLAADLQQVRRVALADPSWLARDEFRSRVDAVLDEFRSRGGRVFG